MVKMLRQLFDVLELDHPGLLMLFDVLLSGLLLLFHLGFFVDFRLFYVLTEFRFYRHLFDLLDHLHSFVLGLFNHGFVDTLRLFCWWEFRAWWFNLLFRGGHKFVIINAPSNLFSRLFNTFWIGQQRCDLILRFVRYFSRLNTRFSLKRTKPYDLLGVQLLKLHRC